MTFVVHGATGAQGAPVAAALAAAGHPVVAAVRHPDRHHGPGGAVTADFTDPGSLAAAWEGADGVFVHLPLGAPQTQYAQAAAIAGTVQRVRPARVVVSTSGAPLVIPDGGDAPAAALANALRAGDTSVAVVVPHLFLENLLLPPVVAGVHAEGRLRYPVRADEPVPWSSHLDVADAVAHLLTDPAGREVTGAVEVGAHPGLVGADLAAGFAEHLGRDVRYEQVTPEDFATAIRPVVGPVAHGIAAMYRARLGLPPEVVDEQRSAQRLLGLAPRPVARWLADLGV